MELDIYRGGSVNVTVEIDERTRLLQRLLGEDIIRAVFPSHDIVDIAIGDYVIHDSRNYYVNNLPAIVKNSSTNFEYNVIFEGIYYNLGKTQFIFTVVDKSGTATTTTTDHLIDSGANFVAGDVGKQVKNTTDNTYALITARNSPTDVTLDTDIMENTETYEIYDYTNAEGEFDLMTDLDGAIDLLIANMNRIDSGWSRGTTDQSDTETKLIHFNSETCMSVLQRLTTEFAGEYYFATQAINFTDTVGGASSLPTVSYYSGLRGITRQAVDSKNIITRLIAFGSERNLGNDYRDFARRLKFKTGAGSVPYLESNVTLYGTIEHTKIFDDVYPHRVNTITSVATMNTYTTLEATGIDFNINNYLLGGISPKLRFSTGDLAGYEFEVAGYVSTTDTLTIIPYQDEYTDILPSATLHQRLGDLFVLTDITMPTSYITTAESLLQTKAQAYLNANSSPRVNYAITPDWRYLKENDYDIDVGDSITITDSDLNITVATRVVELSKSLSKPFKYSLRLADSIEPQMMRRLYDDADDVKRKENISRTGSIDLRRKNWKRSTDEITARRIQTDSGLPGHYKRQLLNRDDNTYRMYDDENNNVLLIDDNIENLVSPGIKIENSSAGGIIYIKRDASNISYLRDFRLFVASNITSPPSAVISGLMNATSSEAVIKATIGVAHTGKLYSGLLGAVEKYYVDEAGNAYFAGYITLEFGDLVSEQNPAAIDAIRLKATGDDVDVVLGDTTGFFTVWNAADDTAVFYVNNIGDADIVGDFTTIGTGIFGDLVVDTDTLVVDKTNKRVGVRRGLPDSALHIKASTSGGHVGDNYAGQLIIQSPTDNVNTNVVITGYKSNAGGDPDIQLWYLGSSAGANENIILLNRRNAILALGTNNTTRVTILGNGDVGVGAVPTLLFSANEKAGMTPIGGFAIKLTNETGANTIAGQLVRADDAVNDAVDLTGANELECIGVFLESGIADGSEAWVVVSGIADVAMEDNVAAIRGYWVRASVDEPGYADVTNATAPQPINQTHFTEIGNCIETVTAGGGGTHILARCVLHFN